MNFISNKVLLRAGFILSLVIIFLSPLILSTGCWDRREPDLLAVVDAVAFDFIEDKALFRVIVQIANPLAGGGEQGSGGGGGGTPSHWVVEGKGHTVFQAFKDLEIRTTRQLLFSHVRVVIFSEGLAKRGIKPVLDLFYRERETRSIVVPFVARGDIRKLMEATFPMEDLGGAALSKQLSVARLERSVVPDVDSLRILVQRLAMPGYELILPLAEFLEKKEEKEGEEQGGEENPVRIAGAAVFRGEKLIGFLDERETAGYMWITRNVRRATLVLKCPGNQENLLTVEVFESEAGLEPIIRDGGVRFKLTMRVEGKIQDFYGDELPLREEFIGSLNRRMADVIRNDITVSLEKARELEVDIFGLGNIIYRTQNKDWKLLEENWEEIFPTVMVDIEIETFIRRHGLIFEPIKIR